MMKEKGELDLCFGPLQMNDNALNYKHSWHHPVYCVYVGAHS